MCSLVCSLARPRVCFGVCCGGLCFMLVCDVVVERVLWLVGGGVLFVFILGIWLGLFWRHCC